MGGLELNWKLRVQCVPFHLTVFDRPTVWINLKIMKKMIPKFYSIISCTVTASDELTIPLQVTTRAWSKPRLAAIVSCTLACKWFDRVAVSAALHVVPNFNDNNYYNNNSNN